MTIDKRRLGLETGQSRGEMVFLLEPPGAKRIMLEAT